MPISALLEGNLGLPQLVDLAIFLPVADQVSVHPEASSIDLLEVIDAA